MYHQWPLGDAVHKHTKPLSKPKSIHHQIAGREWRERQYTGRWLFTQSSTDISRKCLGTVPRLLCKRFVGSSFEHIQSKPEDKGFFFLFLHENVTPHVGQRNLRVVFFCVPHRTADILQDIHNGRFLEDMDISSTIYHEKIDEPKQTRYFTNTFCPLSRLFSSWSTSKTH